MLPIHRLSSEAIEGISYKSNLSSYKGSVYGGEVFGELNGFQVLVNWFYEYDPNQGRLQVWKESDDTNRYTLLERLYDIAEISFTFDKQMLPVICYILKSKCYIYYFDSLDNDYKTTEILGAKFPKVALNSVHFSHIKDSNVVLGYMRDDTKLCVRLQKDRYTIEYLVKEFATKTKLFNIGYASTNRFQYEVLESMV